MPFVSVSSLSSPTVHRPARQLSNRSVATLRPRRGASPPPPCLVSQKHQVYAYSRNGCRPGPGGDLAQAWHGPARRPAAGGLARSLLTRAPPPPARCSRARCTLGCRPLRVCWLRPPTAHQWRVSACSVPVRSGQTTCVERPSHTPPEAYVHACRSRMSVSRGSKQGGVGPTGAAAHAWAPSLPVRHACKRAQRLPQRSTAAAPPPLRLPAAPARVRGVRAGAWAFVGPLSSSLRPPRAPRLV